LNETLPQNQRTFWWIKVRQFIVKNELVFFEKMGGIFLRKWKREAKNTFQKTI